MYVKNAELKAGIVVLASIAALLALLFFATGADLFKPKREIHIRFQQGFAAPKEGDPILMNGVQVGRISEVLQKEEVRSGARLTPEDLAALGIQPGQPGEARELYVLAKAKLGRDQLIPRGTTAEISVSITGTRSLSLLPGRSLENLSDEETHQKPIPGRQAGEIGDILRSVQALVRKVTELVESGQTIFVDIRATIATLHEKIDAIETSEISANVRDATATLKTTLGVLQVRLDEISRDVGAAVVDIRATAAEGKGLAQSAAKDVGTLLATLNRIATQLDELVARNAPQVDAVLADLKAAAENLKGFSGQFGGIGPRVEVLIDDVSGDVKRTFARLAEVGRNLQDASEDIKAHPWKLLNKPEPGEIAYENLRTVAQSWVRAMALVNETIERIDTLSKREAPTEADRATLKALYDDLKRRTAEAETLGKLVAQMLRQGGGPAGSPLR